MAYVEEARQRPRPPLESIVAQQELIGDLRRDAADHVSWADPQKPALREQRMARQGAFLASRESRHEVALQDYEKEMDTLAEECQQKTQEASSRMKGRVDEASDRADALLDPLEKNTEKLGGKTEEQVRGVMTALERVTARRRQDISEFEAELFGIDNDRKERSVLLLRGLAEALTAAAHNVPGEIERLVEKKTLDLDAVLLENQKAVKVLTSKLLVQTLEASKANKHRWHEGLVLWKQKRHRHTVELCMQRICSSEFEQPAGMVDLLGTVKDQQCKVFDGRMELVIAVFAAPLQGLTMGNTRAWEEQNTMLNDKAGDAFERLFADLKSFVDDLDASGESMLQTLVEELKVHDARAEWGEHESVDSLIDADIRPPLKEHLESLRKLLISVTGNVSRQEEVQHTLMTQLLAYFMGVAKKGENLRKRMDEFDMNHKGEEDDCIHDFKEELAKNEGQMKKFKEMIDDAAHHEDLDGLKQKAFDFLNSMEQHYRDHAAQLLEIHNRYPGNVVTFLRDQTAGFCQELGLVLEPLPHEPNPDADPQAAAEAAKAAEAMAAELEGLAEWMEGSREGCKVLEKMFPADVRDKVLAVSSAKVSEAVAAAEAPLAEGDGQAVELEESPLQEVPMLHDGSTVLAMLDFDVQWLEGNFGTLRTTVFIQLNTDRERLGRIDTTAVTEEVRRQLDQRLRRHTNRKGQVQVDWYVPRYSTVAKHKDKFERHLVEVVKKSQGHDETVQELCVQMEKEEIRYKEQLERLRGRLAEAETLPMLTAFERQVGDMAAAFWEACQAIKGKLLYLATRAPQELVKANKDFLKICRSAEEQYSQSEVLFYSSEVEEVNSQLEKKAKEREDRTRELEEQLDEKKQEPLKAFMEQYAEAVEDLSASKGYGKKYGKPRRKAQGLCRALIASSVTVRQNLSEIVEYLDALCGQPVDEVIDFSVLPRCPKFRLRNYFDSAGEPWVFAAELLGVLYIVVCTLSVLGTHLQAFKEDRASLYKLANLPVIRVLREAEVLCPAEVAGDEATKAVVSAEQGLRQGCLEMVLGEVFKADTWDGVIKSVITDAQKESQETFKATVPDFMTKFLADMQETARVARLEAARGLREWADKLRDETLLCFPDILFGELTARAITELRQGTREAQAATVATWAEFDAKRSAHEQRLHPGLSNPNAEEQLRELIEAEAERSERAQAMAVEDCSRMAQCLRGQADFVVQRLSATFESAIRIVDGLPLHTHFDALPGDEQAENPRMSIKRRMRHLHNGTSVDQWGDGLPERKWPGVPRYDLRVLLRTKPWPVDESLAEATEETLQEQTATIDSFRSPLHKRLFERRGFYYDRYLAEFRAEVKRRGAELASRSEHEQTGQRTWQSSVRQLRGEVAPGPGPGAAAEGAAS